MYSIRAHNGQVYGPADYDVIKRWVGEGRIFPNTIIIDHLTDSEGPANYFPLIAQLLPGGGAPMPPQVTPPQPAYQPTTMYQQPGISANQSWSHPPQHTPYHSSIGGYPAFGQTVSHRTKAVAAILAFLFGIFGIHQFYLGRYGLGIAMLLITILSGFMLSWISVIWSLIDMVMIITGSKRDAEGRVLA